jgi:hypothetical protein
LSDRVVSTTDSIAQARHKAVATPPPEKQTPPQHTRNIPPIETSTPPNQSKKGKPKPEDYPDWVKPSWRSFYDKLVDDSELLGKVSEAIDLHPTDNKALAESLVNVKLHKQDGTALGSDSMSRIRGVVKNLNTVTGLTQDFKIPPTTDPQPTRT